VQLACISKLYASTTLSSPSAYQSSLSFGAYSAAVALEVSTLALMSLIKGFVGNVTTSAMDSMHKQTQ
jgi:hypothetical protein